MEIAIEDKKINKRKNLLANKKKEYLELYKSLTEKRYDDYYTDEEREQIIENNRETKEYTDKMIEDNLIAMDAFENLYRYLDNLKNDVDISKLEKLENENNEIYMIIQLLKLSQI